MLFRLLSLVNGRLSRLRVLSPGIGSTSMTRSDVTVRCNGLLTVGQQGPHTCSGVPQRYLSAMWEVPNLSGSPLHEAVQQLAWLLGTWQSEKAEGFYPTIQPFDYKETMEFTHVGQPVLNFTAASFAPDGKPLHRESGFLKVNLGTNHVAYMCAQNIGIVEIEEGDVEGTQLKLESTGIHHMSFASLPGTTKIARTFKLIDESTLEQAVSMATDKNPELVQHLSVRYKKI